MTRPLRTTFGTSLGSKQQLRSVIVRATLDDGAEGVGEAPTSAAFRDETIEAIGRVLREGFSRLKGVDIDEALDGFGALRRIFPHATMTLSGLDTALFRARLASRGIFEHLYWGGSLSRIETDITLPILNEKTALLAWIETAIGKGFMAYKAKMSGDLDRDRETVRLISRCLREKLDRFRLRLDGNQGYTAKAFLAFVDFLEKTGIEVEVFEQPLPKDDFAGLAYVAARCPMPLILDETICTAEDARRAADRRLGHGINIKIAKSGIGESKKILEIAKASGMKLMAGCMIETMVGLSAAVFLTAGAGVFDFIDLDAVHFLYGRNAYPGIGQIGPLFIIDTSETAHPVAAENRASNFSGLM